MFLYIMLAYLMLFYLMLLVCIMLNYFLTLAFANAFCFHVLSLTHSLLISNIIMHSALNQIVFQISCSHRFVYERAMCSLVK